MAGDLPSSGKVVPVILSGGSGTRLWPLSRALYPKQLLPLCSERSLLQETALRVAGDGFAPPLLVCNDEHRFIVAEQMRALGRAPGALVLEPAGRNTAPAAAVAALMLVERDADAMMLVLPSDHVIGDRDAFARAVTVAEAGARSGALVTFGVRPQGPETGYGYIQKADSPGAAGDCTPVARFVEKPDLKEAKSFLAAGDYYWNSGIFLFSAARYLAELERFAPEIVAACRRAVAEGARDLDFFRLGAEAFAACPARSIDYAVMERTESAAMVPVEMGWSDVGSWSALWDVGEKDAEGNVVGGDVLAQETTNSYLRTSGPMLAAVGLNDVIVVATDDAVLAVAKDRAQDVRALVERLKSEGRSEHETHTTVYRPWGSFQTLELGDRYQVKQIIVKPGAALSLQKHRHRAEHWIVVSGTARVTRGDETFELSVNQSTYIPQGAKHRLENPGHAPLCLIEVQSGDYLGEDDIIRFTDVYGRK